MQIGNGDFSGLIKEILVEVPFLENELAVLLKVKEKELRDWIDGKCLPEENIIFRIEELWVVVSRARRLYWRGALRAWMLEPDGLLENRRPIDLIMDGGAWAVIQSIIKENSATYTCWGEKDV